MTDRDSKRCQFTLPTIHNCPQRHCTALRLRRTTFFSTATLTCRSETHSRGLSVHRAAAEGQSRQIPTPGITQLCSQCCYSSYLQKNLKHFHSIPLIDAKEHYCPCSPEKCGEAEILPRVMHVTDTARNRTTLTALAQWWASSPRLGPQLKLYHSAHKQSIET